MGTKVYVRLYGNPPKKGGRWLWISLHGFGGGE